MVTTLQLGTVAIYSFESSDFATYLYYFLGPITLIKVL